MTTRAKQLLRLSFVKSALEVASTVVLIVACGVFIWKVREESATGASTDLITAQDARGRIEAGQITSSRGSAPLILIEFVDFQCPFCVRFARDTLPRIKEEFIDTGALEFAVLNYPLQAIHPRAFRASEAAECAGRQGRYWEMHDLLFTVPSDLSDSDLRRYATDLGLDTADFDACLEGAVREKIQADIAEAVRLGVVGTPVFFFGIREADGSVRLLKRLNGAVQYEAIRAEVEALQRGQALEASL